MGTAMKRSGWLTIAMCIGLFGEVASACAQANPPVVMTPQVEQVAPAAESAGLGEHVPSGQAVAYVLKQALQVGAMFTVVTALKTVAHELGHAAVTALFDASKIEAIHLFSGFFNRQPELFSVGKIHVHKGIWGGRVDMDPFQERYKQCLVFAGGVLGAVGFCSFLLTLVMCYCHLRDGKSLTEDVTGLLQKPFKPFKSIVDTKNLTCEQKITLLNFVFSVLVAMMIDIFYVLTPNGLFLPGDGDLLWYLLLGARVAGTSMTLEGNSVYIHRALQWVSLLGELGCFGWLVKRYYDARTQVYAQVTPLVEGDVAQQVPIAAVAAA